MRRANMFNEDLIASTRDGVESPQQIKFKVGTSASAAQPQMLLGATLRPHNSCRDKEPVPIFGLRSLSVTQDCKLNDPTPFGISLAIPSLPPYEPNLESADYPKTFFSFEPTAKKEQRIETNLAVASTSPPNKREVKKEAKLKSKKPSIWNLMPYVDESLLDHNLKAESGISRLWEDHSIHLSLRNLKVGEPGLITRQKEQFTLERYQEATRLAIKVSGNTRTIKQIEFIQKIILLLQGIPSQ
jgi:hypothetical protein